MNPDKIVWITEDGTWGTAPIIILDTTDWSEEKWAELESKSDNRHELWQWGIDNA